MIFELMNDAVKLDSGNDVLVMASPAKCDFFIDGGTGVMKTNAPFYHTEMEGDFIVRCEVRPQFIGTYDAGGLCAYESATRWIKLAFEKTDLGYESVVSVVTDTTSDDCNGERIEGGSVWLQIVRKNNMWCLHHSKDGEAWKMSRYFSMAMDRKIKIGIVAQSPAGKGCAVQFRHLAVDKMTYSNLRSAS